MPLHTAASNQICVAIALSIALMMVRGACGRQDVGGATANLGVGMAGVPLYMARNADVQQVLLNELLTNTNEDALYSELSKFHHQQPNYLSKWPGLRDLLLTADYDDNAMGNGNGNGAGAGANDGSDSNEAVNMRFVERLRQLAASAVDDMENARADSHSGASEVLPNALPLPKAAPVASSNQISFKEHGIKKNVQYMSPCHFKICNMGRKRNARFFDN